jgi:molybdopterin converting factor small subunit
MELAAGTSIRELLDQLNIGIDEPKVMFINGVHARLDDIIKDGDRVAIFPPIAGG